MLTIKKKKIKVSTNQNSRDEAMLICASTMILR